MSVAVKLCRETIKKLTPYASARRIGGTGDIWINANEAPDNHCVTMELTALNRYPEFQPPDLLHAYSRFCHRAEEQILITRGADEGIELLIRTFCEPGQDYVAFCPPTYGMYAISAETCGVTVKKRPTEKQFAFPFDELYSMDEQCKILFLCHPNNPTGTLTDKGKLETLLKKRQGKTLVVVDEAYIEFCAEYDVSDLIMEYDNLVVLRTLSKAFGLAALRCGFVLAQPEIIECLKKVIAPYPVPGPVTSIAVQALSDTGLRIMQERVDAVNATKQHFTAAIASLPCTEAIIPGAGNFITVRFKEAKKIWQALQQANIIARDVSHYLYLEDCIRFTIGSAEEMAKVASVLQQQ